MQVNKKFLRKIFEKIIAIVFPNKCAICDKIIEKNSICPLCKNRIYKRMHINRKVYLTSEKIDEKYYNFDEFMHLFKYEGIIKEKIIQYKFVRKSYLYKFFAEIIAENDRVIKYISKYDYIIPVPLNKYRKRERGYNQTELIIEEVKKIFNSSGNDSQLENKILIKKKNSKRQSKLNKIDRKNNLKGAYTINLKEVYKIKNKKILLFDDVFTTGSTVNECSKEIKKFNPKKIGILTIAKD